MPGTLVICATPIGNLGDVSPRLAEALAGVDLIYAEDTRRTSVLLASIGVAKPIKSYFVGNEEARARELALRLESGETIAFVTDAGTPAVADPGMSAVRAARSVGASIGVVPGPSAVTTAVACSGFPADRFVFEGFLPRKGRRAAIAALVAEQRTMVIFTTPHRLLKDLAELGTGLGTDRAIFIARELTKKFEELWWGTIAEAVEVWTERVPKGEFTVVIGGSAGTSKVDVDLALTTARQMMNEGMSRSAAAREAAASCGVSRRSVYESLV